MLMHPNTFGFLWWMLLKPVGTVHRSYPLEVDASLLSSSFLFNSLITKTGRNFPPLSKELGVTHTCVVAKQLISPTLLKNAKAFTFI